jgi:hypothetical protein
MLMQVYASVNTQRRFIKVSKEALTCPIIFFLLTADQWRPEVKLKPKMLEMPLDFQTVRR